MTKVNEEPQSTTTYKDYFKTDMIKWLLLIIPIVYMVVTLFYPMINLFKLSLFDDDGFTMKYIMNVFTKPLYLKVLWITLKISFIVTFISLLISYPVAYLLVKVKAGIWANIIIASALIPFWISQLVRSFSWIVILQSEGVINSVLLKMGVIDEPLKLLYTTTAVVIGMVHVLYPYMLLSVYSVMKGIDFKLLQAAQGLGAKPYQSFLQITLPLSIPGIIAGSLLVFVMSLGFYVTPALLGGSNDMMISSIIANYINVSLNWNLASALSLILFVVIMLILSVLFFIMKNQSIFKEVE